MTKKGGVQTMAKQEIEHAALARPSWHHRARAQSALVHLAIAPVLLTHRYTIPINPNPVYPFSLCTIFSIAASCLYLTHTAASSNPLPIESARNVCFRFTTSDRGNANYLAQIKYSRYVIVLYLTDVTLNSQSSSASNEKGD